MHCKLLSPNSSDFFSLFVRFLRITFSPISRLVLSYAWNSLRSVSVSKNFPSVSSGSVLSLQYCLIFKLLWTRFRLSAVLNSLSIISHSFPFVNTFSIFSFRIFLQPLSSSGQLYYYIASSRFCQEVFPFFPVSLVLFSCFLLKPSLLPVSSRLFASSCSFPSKKADQRLFLRWSAIFYY